MPCQIGTTKSYGGCGATQKLVDHFAMANGRYPIRNLEDDNYKNGLGVIDIVPQSGYKVTGYTSMLMKSSFSAEVQMVPELSRTILPPATFP